MKVGSKFNSYREFKEALELFQTESNTQFVVRNSTKLEVGSVNQEKFVFSFIKFTCKQGKLRHQSTARHGEKMRPNQRSYKVNFQSYVVENVPI